LLKLYLYGYLQQIRSSRRLESECQRNVELMWLLRRLHPDHKSIAEFRRMHGPAVTQAGAELVKFARSVGLIRGEWIAIDGSKFRAVSSVSSVQERTAVELYLESLETADGEDEPIVEKGAVAAALEKLRRHTEPEAGFMKTAQGMLPAYNVQTAVDAEQGLIVAQKVIDEPNDKRSLNTQGDGQLFDRTAFQYQEQSNTMLCPAGHSLRSDGRNGRAIVYLGRAEVCGACALKPQCTVSPRRTVKRHVHEGALQRMQQRATPEAMQLRRRTVEHPFAILKYAIFGHPRFLLRGLAGARAEISLAVMAYNLKRMLNLMGGAALRTALAAL
jgi:hypothetical protein